LEAEISELLEAAALELVGAALFEVIAVALTPEQLAELSPLSVMQMVMRECFEVGDHRGALAAAEIAAPYCHAKLARTDLGVTNSPASNMSHEVLQAEIALLEREIRERVH
jgi:hypothetical protein